MALTRGAGPFASQGHVENDQGEDGCTLLFEPSPRRIRLCFAGWLIAAGSDVTFVHKTGKRPLSVVVDGEIA